jgi:hypothetical protein
MTGAGDDIDNIVKRLNKDREGSGPPAKIFTSGDQFMDHMELHDSSSHSRTLRRTIRFTLHKLHVTNIFKLPLLYICIERYQ